MLKKINIKWKPEALLKKRKNKIKLISILEIFKKMWVTRSEWNEKGSGIIHIKTI